MEEKEFLKIYKEVIDYLFPLQTPTEQAVYNYLLRWTYFESGKNQIQIGYASIAKQLMTHKPTQSKLGNLSANATRRTIRNLVKKGHIVVKETHIKGNIYLVKLPSEIEESLKLKEEKNKNPLDTLSEDYFTDSKNRKLIFERDKYCCHYCGQKVTENNATLDHKIPQSKGGDNSKENLVTCCFDCNSIKSGKTLEEVAPKLLERLKRKINK
jgi:hypothetical protein